MNQGFVYESTAGKITDSAPRESPGSATLPFVKFLNRDGYLKTHDIVLICRVSDPYSFFTDPDPDPVDPD